MAEGYAAVTVLEEILVDTVSPTESAAMVNWLYVHAKFAVPVGMGDFAIRDQFGRAAFPVGVAIRKVEITLKD